MRLKRTLSTQQTILSTMGAAVFGGRSNPLYGVLQASTAAILCLSANTSFADFPRLSSIIARDGFPPTIWPAAATAWSSPTGSSPEGAGQFAGLPCFLYRPQPSMPSRVVTNL
jgi:hypothetical protein